MEKERREKIIKAFLMEEPHMLSYEYRKQTYKEDRPILNELIREGLIKQIDKGSKWVVYRYVS